MVDPSRVDFIFDLVLWKIIWGQSGTFHDQFSDVAYAISLKAIFPVSLGHIRALMTTHHAILPYQQRTNQKATKHTEVYFICLEVCCNGEDFGSSIVGCPVSTNQIPVSGLIWANERAPICLWWPDSVVLAWSQHVQILLLLQVVVLQSGVEPLDPHGVGDVENLQKVFIWHFHFSSLPTHNRLMQDRASESAELNRPGCSDIENYVNMFLCALRESLFNLLVGIKYQW